MSNDKTTIARDQETIVMSKVGNDGTLAGEKKPAEVLKLTIDDNDDFGGDPYNHTGSFCVPDFGD